MVVVLLAAFTHANPNRDDRKCVIDHLQKKGILDSSYGEPHDSTYCESFVTKHKKEQYDNVRLRLQGPNGTTLDKDCVIDKLKENNYIEYVFKEFVHQTDRTTSVKQLQIQFEEDREVYKKILVRASIQCSGLDSFGKYFDEIYKGDSTENAEEEPDVDYCLRKYIEQNNFIDPKVYTMNLNPTNIDISGVDCVVLIKKSRKEAADFIHEELKTDGFLPQVLECVEQIYTANNAVDQMITVSYLSELKLNDQQLTVFRNKFVDMMTNITVGYSYC